MTETIPVQPAPAPPGMSLGARVLGVFLAPYAAYADVVARPHAFGVLVVVILASALATGTFLSTEIGQNVTLDRQAEMMESMGLRLNDEQLARIEESAGRTPYIAAASQAVVLPLVTAIVSGVLLAVFNVLLGGEASFRQVFAIVAHSGLILALQVVFAQPLNYVNETLDSPTALNVFFPMLDPSGYPAFVLGWLDLFRAWWLINLSIGLAVLYKRKTGPIAATFVAGYVVLVLIITAAWTAFGRS